MILSVDTSPASRAARSELVPIAVGVPVPAWLRRGVTDARTLDDATFSLGAAINALDAVVRRDTPWAGAWRQRLALAAAATLARQNGRTEDAAGLRDTIHLTRPGDDVGPAGRLYLAWRRLASRRADEMPDHGELTSIISDLGLPTEDTTVNDLVAALRQAESGEGIFGTFNDAFAAAGRRGCRLGLGAWLADMLLARKLGWVHAVPLLGAYPVAAKDQLIARARAALVAIDLSAELGRRAERLLAVAPKLRAKRVNRVVEKLLTQDAMTASDTTMGLSDRALRRVFDRLVELDVVRELTGRTAFRIYGL